MRKRISTQKKEEKERNERRKEVIKVCSKALDDYEARGYKVGEVHPCADLSIQQLKGDN